MAAARYWFGALLAGISGVVLGYAWSSGDGGLWWMGGLTLLSGLLVLLSGLYATRRLRDETVPGVLHLGAPGDDSAPTPLLLGDLLVNRYGLVTYDQLGQALAQQRGTQQRLGEVLVAMGFLSERDLNMVLEDQRLHRDVWERLGVVTTPSYVGEP